MKRTMHFREYSLWTWLLMGCLAAWAMLSADVWAEEATPCDTIFLTWTAEAGEEKSLGVGVEVSESWDGNQETFRVDWGDGTYLSSDIWGNPSFTQTYAESGSYAVMVYTTTPEVRINFFECGGAVEKDNGVTSLDVSLTPALECLSCGYNQLTSLDVSQNPVLVNLYCYNNQLTSLDVSRNTVLQTLSCFNNQLSSLNVSQNPALVNLYCSNNQLTSLAMSQSLVLEYLDCYNNQLTSLDVRQNPALGNLWCGKNQLTSLDVSKNTALTELSCWSNQLTSLDVSQNTALTYLYCYNNQLLSLDVSQNSALEYLDCQNSHLSSLNVRHNGALNYLCCSYNQLTSLDVSQNTALTYLYCNNNQLLSLDVSQNAALEHLHCSWNQLTLLDLSQNPTLVEFGCDNNKLSVMLDEDNGLDLNALPGLDVSRIGRMRGGRIEGTRLIFELKHVRYSYATHFPGDNSDYDTVEFILEASKFSTANEVSLTAAPFAYVQGRTVYLSDDLGEVEAFTATGQRVYRGNAHTIALPQPGVYILRVVADGRRSKIIVR